MNTNILFYFSLLFLLGCASPQKHFSKGNYQKAFNSALSDLQKKNDRKLKQILNQSFDEILEDKTYRIANLSASSELRKWEEAFELYQDIMVDYDRAHRFLNPKYDTIVDKLIDENELLALMISDRFEELAYDNMEEYERHNDKYAAQQANKYFNRIQYYQPDYPGIDTLLNLSYNAGVINYLVDVNIWDFTYQWDIDQEFGQLKNKSWGYYRVFYNTVVSNIDCEIDLNFDQLQVTELESRTHSQSYSKEIQDGYETVVDTSGNSKQVPRYIQVEGYVTTLATTRNYTWNINMIVDRYSNYCQVAPRVFSATESATKEKYELSGDERAIPSRFKNAFDNDYDLNERQIVKDLIRDLYHQVSSHINIRR